MLHDINNVFYLAVICGIILDWNLVYNFVMTQRYLNYHNLVRQELDLVSI